MAREITIVDMMKILAPQKSIVDLIYEAMDRITSAQYASDELRQIDQYRAAREALNMAVNICYDRR